MGKNKKKSAEKSAELAVVAKNDTAANENPEKPNYYPCKEESSNIFSKILFAWTDGLVTRGNHHYLQPNDLFDIKETQKFEHVLKEFNHYFTKYHDPKKGPRTGKAILATTKKWLIINLVFTVAGNLLQFSGPLCLSRILKNLSDETTDAKDAYIFASVLLGCYLLRSILVQHGLHATYYNAFATVASMQGSIFQKVLRMKNSAKKYYDAGKVLTMTTVDSFALFMFAQFGNYMFSSPIMVVVAVVLICLEVGWLGLVGPAILLISMILQNIVQKATERTRKQLLFYNDKRSKALSEYITGIRVIKFYGWERMVQKKVQEIRKHEAGFIFKTAILRAITELLTSVVPIVISIVIFSLYSVVLNEELTPAKAYSVLALFNLIQVPLRLLTIVLVALANANVSLKRIGHFLTAEEYDNYVVRDDPNMATGDIQIEDGVFAWDTESARLHYKKMETFNRIKKRGGPPAIGAGSKPGASPTKGENPASPKINADGPDSNPGSPKSDGPGSPKSGSPIQKKGKGKKPEPVPDKPLRQEDLIVLKNINFKAKKGQLVGIIGQVGAGKSSLLNALLGELDKIGGNVKAKGSVAFISQQAVLRNATVRDNITFTFPFDEEKYANIIEKCELVEDIKILPGADMTEIGERGINLSGGQKQRISIARAVYANADIYVIDDCLSALDMHVGGRIFKNILQGMLKDKTVIFVTHAMHYVEHADYLYVMKEGQIIEEGSPMELRAKPDSEYNHLNVRIKKDTTMGNQETIESKEGKEAAKKEPTLIIEDILENHTTFTLDEINHSIALERIEAVKGDLVKIDGDPEGEQEINTKKPEENSPDVDIGKILEDNKKEEEKKEEKPAARKETSAARALLTNKGTLIKTETAAQGAVSWHAWKAYMASGGYCLTFMVFVTFGLFQGTKIVNDWWLGQWSDDAYGLSSGTYIYIYASVGVAAAVVTLLKGVFYGFFTRNSAQNIQASVLWAVLRSPTSWFDVTPMGRIINRTNKDQDDIDQTLPWTLQFSFQNILMLISTLVMIGIILPLFYALAAVFLVAYLWWLKKYIRASREMKRIENISRSPILQLLSEACNGSAVIRSFDASAFYLKNFATKFNNYLVAAYNGQYAQRWIGMRTEIFGDAVIAGTAYFGALSKDLSSIADPALVGLAISYALQIIGLLTFTVRMIGDCEMQMSSFERLLEYKEKKDLEADFESPKAPAKWPFAGQYEIKDISYQYRPQLPHVIHKISFSINSHEKIGVVGRTGSGKSTLTLGLLRILELAENEGTHEKGAIVLDNQDISQIGLHELRKKITIIPQDPTLFTGTIRSNIDPFEEFSDEKIIDALKKVQIWNALKETDKQGAHHLEVKKKEKKPKKNKKDKKKNDKLTTENDGLIDIVSGELEGAKKLNMMVDDGGANFSLGQRQLLCMARALIRDSKVLLMDEATASIDEKTDRLLQKMIKTEFKTTTVITIAHRLNTIIQYDKILVLDNGKIVQFDTPLNLLNQEGIFSTLIRSHGKDFEAKMIELAMDREKDLD